jgi:hypothetical protein
MKHKLLLILFFVVCRLSVYANDGFDKAIYYKAIASNDILQIENQLPALEKSSLPEKEGYKGALLMKKAALIARPVDKLTSFKAGHTLLENALKKDNGNIEWHLLRLIIQEHAPRILNYYHDIDKDALFLKKQFKHSEPLIQQMILDYCKQSKVITIKDFPTNE